MTQPSTSATQKYPLHRLPLPSKTLQRTFPRLKLDDKPSAQRRSTTFPQSTEGIWARVNPLWAAWPLQVTKEEALEMGVDVDNGGQLSVEDVLRRWEPVDIQDQEGGRDGEDGNGLKVASSRHRLKLDPILLGISSGALSDSLPHLDVGDALALCDPYNTSTTAGYPDTSTSSASTEARQSLIDILSGRKVLQSEAPADGGESYGPWSTRYVGHQFGVWAGQLGDGRAISLLETESDGGGRQEIQLKGAGRTPFSRTADGLAVLRSGVREFLGCEAIAALGIPTTRSLALLTTPIPSLPVLRENGPEPSSLLCRLAPSFIRIGHFQALNPGKEANARQFYLGGSGWMDDQSDSSGSPAGNLEGLRQLAEWVKGDVMVSEGGVREWFGEVVKRNAETVAQWQVYGWMHGVLNTDNISPLGLTIDYGPYAFMDVFDNNHICNHSDPSGLYSYRAQPSRVLFALDKLASALSPLIGYEAIHSSPPPPEFSKGATKEQVREWEAKGDEVLGNWAADFWETERKTEREGWLKRFGLKTYQDGDDRSIVANYLKLLESHKIDFHTSFRALSSLSPSQAAIVSADGSADLYLSEFVGGFIKSSSTGLSSEAVSRATEDLVRWFRLYAKRASMVEEQRAWSTTSSATSATSATSTSTKRESKEASGSGWEHERQKGMDDVNPRFVLRQWVLEELIGKMEKALTAPYLEAVSKSGSDDGEGEVDQERVEEGIRSARRDLAKILDMSARPFEPWGEHQMPPSVESASAEVQQGWLEERRLCGLGKREMLGFQCSCSS